jgi:hypothetical protein
MSCLYSSLFMFNYLLIYNLYDSFLVADCLFSLQVKNKPWLPWVYSWIWHSHEQLEPEKIAWKFQQFLLLAKFYKNLAKTEK